MALTILLRTIWSCTSRIGSRPGVSNPVYNPHPRKTSAFPVRLRPSIPFSRFYSIWPVDVRTTFLIQYVRTDDILTYTHHSSNMTHYFFLLLSFALFFLLIFHTWEGSVRSLWLNRWLLHPCQLPNMLEADPKWLNRRKGSTNSTNPLPEGCLDAYHIPWIWGKTSDRNLECISAWLPTN